MKPISARARLTYLLEFLQMRVRKYFRVLDTLDADALASFFSTGATVRLAGASPILGRAAIRKAFVQLSLEVDELRHDPVTLWTAGSLSVLEADVTLTLGDHTTTAFPATYSLRWVEGLIEEASVNLYLESRIAIAMSAFDRVRRESWSKSPSSACGLAGPTPCSARFPLDPLLSGIPGR